MCKSGKSHMPRWRADQCTAVSLHPTSVSVQHSEMQAMSQLGPLADIPPGFGHVRP
jgi:hypothetical protein